MEMLGLEEVWKMS